MKTVQIPEGAGDVGAPTLEQFAVLADQVQELAQRCGALEAAVDELSGVPAPVPEPPPAPPAPVPPPPPPVPQLVEGKAITPVPTMPKPAKGQPYVDPTFGTRIVRLTDHAAELPSGFARCDYSRRQAFNADCSLALVYAFDGHWHLYDAVTYAHVRVLPGLAGDAEPQWHPTDPRLLFFLPTNGGMVVNELDVVTGVIRAIGNFTGRLPWSNVARLWTKSEGSPSADGRYWAFMAETSSFSPVGLVVWDRVADSIVSMLPNSNRPDHLSMSPSGDHVVVSWNDGVTCFDRMLRNPRVIHRYGQHSDIALDENGDDIYVAFNQQSNGGDLEAVNLRTGEKLVLFPTYLAGSATAYHVSGKGYGKPGWVLVSTYADYGGTRPQWLHRKVFAVQLKANPRIVQLAHHHSEPRAGSGIGDQYWAEPHASVSRDFSRALFTSNWHGSRNDDVDAYMIELPAF